MSSAVAQKKKVFVVGVGMIKFEKPGKRDWDYPKMGQVAGMKALADAGIPYNEVQQAVVGYVYGDSTCGQRAVYEIGLTGIPVYNVNNNCSTGSTALFLAKQLVEGGQADCVLAMGFEKMERGSLKGHYNDRASPMEKHMSVIAEKRGLEAVAFAPQMFGNAGREHMEKYGTTQEHFAKIAWKNHKHSTNNPYSQFRDEYSLNDILKSRKVFDPLTMLQCCPTSDGAAAAVLANEEFVKKHNLQHQAIEIVGMTMATDVPATFQGSMISMVGGDMVKKAAEELYGRTGLSPNDVQVIELHDCFSCNELVSYEALGLCPPGHAGKLIDAGDNTYGGKWVVNPSGGLISKGHPLGATGLAQCAELCWQLRGMCGKRQVKDAKVALQHNIGLGGAAVLALYKHGFPELARPYPANKPNPAIDENPDAVDTPTTAVNTASVAPAEPSTSSAASSSSASSSGGGAIDAVFDEMRKGIAAEPSLVQKVGAVYQFVINGADGKSTSWTVDLKNGSGSVQQKAAEKADCTITMKEADFLSLVAGKLDAQQAFMKGQLNIGGNMGLAMKLGMLFKKKAAL